MMSRLFSSTVSYLRVPRSLMGHMRMNSSYSQSNTDDWFGRKCPKPQENTCEPSISNPESKPVCTTEALPTGRSDADFDKCLKDQIANPLHECTNQNFKNFPCEKSPIPEDRNKEIKVPGESAWTLTPCCTFHKCEIETIRHDILYLKPEDKCLRRTWHDWSDHVCNIDKECQSPKAEVEEPEFRPRVIRPPEIIPHCVKPNPCHLDRPRGQINKAPTADQPKVEINPCPRMRLAGCKPARPDVKCYSPIKPACCQKRCTPYPSFSECAKKTDFVCMPQKADSECNCITNISTCQLFQRADWLK